MLWSWLQILLSMAEPAKAPLQFLRLQIISQLQER